MSSSTITKRPEIIKTYKLEDPIEYGSEYITELNFRRIKVKDHVEIERHVDAGPIEKSSLYLQRLTEQPPFVIENLSQTDFMQAQEILGSFLKQGLKIT